MVDGGVRNINPVGDVLGLEPDEIVVTGQSRAYARFDLTGAAIGVYSLLADSGNLERELKDSLQVVEGTGNRLQVKGFLWQVEQAV